MDQSDKHDSRPAKPEDIFVNEYACASLLVCIEQIPEFAGGPNALYRFIGRNLRYPAAARVNKIQERVYAIFTVEADRTVSNPLILKGLGYATYA